MNVYFAIVVDNLFSTFICVIDNMWLARSFLFPPSFISLSFSLDQQ